MAHNQLTAEARIARAQADHNVRVLQQLENTFEREWHRLSFADKMLILRDCTEEGGISDFAEYRRCIGTGNLQAYADTQQVRFK